MLDLVLIPDRDGDVAMAEPEKANAAEARALLQRALTLALSGGRDMWYTAAASPLRLAIAGNIPADAAVDAMLGLACADTMSRLDAADRELVSSFSGSCSGGVVTLTLTLRDGTAATTELT